MSVAFVVYMIYLTVNLIYESMKLFFYRLEARELCDVTILYFGLSFSPWKCSVLKLRFVTCSHVKLSILNFLRLL